MCLWDDFAAKSPRLTLDTIRQNGSRRRRVPGTEGGYGAVTRANRRMIFASRGSLTALVACPGDGAFVLLRPFLALLPHLERDHMYPHPPVPPLGRGFSYEKDPSGSRPTPPASSYASRAADRWGVRPLCGQPFGMIQRRVSPKVTSITSARAPPFLP
jgi:hypothetical protein